MSCLAFLGCGNAEGLVPVSGTVTIDGQPLKMGNIRFVPEKGRPSGGTIDENGRYTMTSRVPGDGVSAGTLMVEVTSNTAKGKTVHWLIPQKYSDYKTSGEKVTVDGPNDNLDIKLTWKDSGHDAPYDVVMQGE
ncbi:MAG: hypothetical protein QM811_31370 [Pirellulales bacterium]